MNQDRRPRLLVIATHPIQYQAPLFRALAKSELVDLTVAFLDIPDAGRQGAGFGVKFSWDVSLTDGYTWIRLDSNVATGEKSSSFMGRRWRRPLTALREIRPDVVMVMGWNQFGLLQAWLAAKWRRLPLIVRGESNSKRDRAGWKRFLHRRLLSIPDLFLAIGNANREFYMLAGVGSDAIRLAPYFVDNEFFAARAAAVDRHAVRSSWGIATSDLCVLFAGKFEPKKRPSDLLAAVRELPAEVRVRTAVLMVGSGPLEAELRSQAAGIRVTWAGFLNQTEIPAAYAAADVLVLPSDHGETWGLVVNEAAACGVPAIVSDQVGCAGDLVRSGETGLVFPMGDVRALSDAIRFMAEHPGRRAEMAESARALVEKAFTIAGSTDAITSAVIELHRAKASTDDAGLMRQ